MQVYKYLSLILLFIMIIFASGCIDNNQNQNNNSTENNSPTQVNEPLSSDISVAVSYQGTWNGTISDNSGNRTAQGNGNRRYNLGPNPGSVSASFQKLGNDNLQLRVEILNGTDVIESRTSQNPFGNVTITRNF